jgi:hypothetical protein
MKGLAAAQTVLNAAQEYQQNKARGMDTTQAVATAGANAMFNQFGGHLATAKGVLDTYQANVDAGQSKGEAVASTIGSVGGGHLIGSGVAGTAIGVINTGLQVAGAPQGVTDVTQTVADVVPATFITQTATQAARGVYNIATGDMKALDRQVGEMEEGKAGAPLKGYAMLTDVVAQGAATGDWEGAIMKVGSKGQDSALARAGNFLGDQTYQFVNEDLPRASAAVHAKYDAAQQQVHEAAAAVGAKVDQAKAAVTSTVGEVRQDVHQAEAAVSETYQDAKQAAATTVAEVKEEVHQAAEVASQKYDEAKQAARDVADRAGQQADKAVEAAKRKLSEYKFW